MKKTIFFVFAAHLLVLCWMALWLPEKKEVKKIQVNTYVKATPPPKLEPTRAPKVIQATAKPPTPTKKRALKKTVSPVKKTPVIPPQLLKELENSIAKIDQKSDKEMPRSSLSTPKWIAMEELDGDFTNKLIESLQKHLTLPEKGLVKVKLTLSREGKYLQLEILQSGSSANELFLKKELKKVPFPPFDGPLKKENEHAFVLTFCSS